MRNQPSSRTKKGKHKRNNQKSSTDSIRRSEMETNAWGVGKKQVNTPCNKRGERSERKKSLKKLAEGRSVKTG